RERIGVDARELHERILGEACFLGEFEGRERPNVIVVEPRAALVQPGSLEEASERLGASIMAIALCASATPSSGRAPPVRRVASRSATSRSHRAPDRRAARARTT